MKAFKCKVYNKNICINLIKNDVNKERVLFNLRKEFNPKIYKIRIW